MPKNKDDIDLSGGELFGAAKQNRFDIVRAQLDRGAEVNLRSIDSRGDTLLHGAALNSFLDVARLLIEHGADVNARITDDWTPLHEAATDNSLDVARLLIEKGANTDGIDLSWMYDQEDA